MALAAVTLDALSSVLRRMTESAMYVPGDPVHPKVLSLGYPDILASEDHIRYFFGDTVANALRFRADSEAIIRWHGMQQMMNKVPEAESLFAALGLDLEVLDLVSSRGGELIADLNHDIGERYREKYAVVIDGGTMEHCFNIAQAAKNIAQMVAPGGAVIHGNPLNMFNHGFYNLNPTWYQDFYDHNGFVLDSMKLVSNSVLDPRLADIPPFERFRGIPDDCVMLVVARRVEVRNISWPIQKKYRENPTLGG